MLDIAVYDWIIEKLYEPSQKPLVDAFCSKNGNNSQCVFHVSNDIDALSIDWDAEFKDITLWCNPVYTRDFISAMLFKLGQTTRTKALLIIPSWFDEDQGEIRDHLMDRRFTHLHRFEVDTPLFSRREKGCSDGERVLYPSIWGVDVF